MPQQGMTDLSRLRKRPLETDAATSARAAVRAAAPGHEGRFPPPRLSAGCGSRKGDNRRNAPQRARRADTGRWGFAEPASNRSLQKRVLGGKARLTSDLISDAAPLATS